MSEFTGRKVLITGAAGVFGHWILEAFLKAGANIICSDIRVDALRQQVASLGSASGNIKIYEDDLENDDSLISLVDKVKTLWKSPDIFVDCAGIYPFNNILEVSNSEWDRIFNVNVRAPFILTRDVANLMIKHKIEGSIIHIGSGAARSLRLNGLPYCISKTALERLAKGFALELAPHGIRVNIVEPGFAPGSEMTTFPTGYVDTVLEGIPLGRSSGPTDAASAVLYLCSNAASFITGTSLSVDGGNSLGQKHGRAALQSTSD